MTKHIGPQLMRGLVVALTVVVVGALTLTSAVAAGNTTWTDAGTAVSGNTGDGGQAREAQIDEPRSIFPTGDGGYVFAEPWSDRVRKVGPDGIITTLAGTGIAGFSGDGGPATAAQVNFVHSAAPLADGSYLLADTLNNRIRQVSAGGVITTIVGDGTAGYSGDGGPATAAQINNPRGIVALPNNSGFVFPDTNNNRVRKVASNGIITTVAGTGVQGFSGDGGAATSAQLSLPFAVAPTPDGGLLVVDVGNQRIRKVSASGVITTVAGTGTGGFSGDGGPANVAQVNNPHNLVARADGSFLIADASNERVRQVAANSIMSTFIGTGTRGYTGDGGPANVAQISVPKAVGLTAFGDLLIAEEQNNVIRFVGTPVAPPATAAPSAISGLARQGDPLNAFPGGWSGTGPTFAYQWRRCDGNGAGCTDIAGASGKIYTPVAADVGATLRILVTAGNTAGVASRVSAQTASVVPPAGAPANTAAPSISGTAQTGQTLTAADGTWTGSAPITFAYQWERCNTSGAGCTDIGGATGKTYGVATADVGATLRVQVTGSNSTGSSAAISAPTATVTSASSSGTLTLTGASADDGDVSVSNAQSAGYPPPGTPAANTTGGVFTSGRRLTSWGTYNVLNGLIRFDTSVLPANATVTAATLRIFVTAKSDADRRNLVAEYYSAWPIDAADWTATAANGAVAGVAVGGLTVGATNDLPLTNLASVSSTSFTGLRLHIDGGVPAGDNFVQFASNDSTTNPHPQLIVSYTTGGTVSAPANTAAPSASRTAQAAPATSVPQTARASTPAPAAGPPAVAAAGGLSASDTSGGQVHRVTLVWRDTSSGRNTFVLERTTDPTFLTGVTRTRLGAGVTRFDDRTVQPNTAYYYRLYALSPEELRSPPIGVAVTTR